MDYDTFTNWSKQFPGIVPAIKSVDDSYRITNLIEKIAFIKEEPIGMEILATSPIQLHDGYVEPAAIYAAWEDGKLYNLLDERNFNRDLLPSLEEEISMLFWRSVPIAIHFVGAKQVRSANYIVIVLRSGGFEIETLSVTIYRRPPPDLDLEQVVLEIAAAFKNGGLAGVEDWQTRFNTGVGLGECRLISYA